MTFMTAAIDQRPGQMLYGDDHPLVRLIPRGAAGLLGFMGVPAAGFRSSGCRMVTITQVSTD
jgi:hypothetical protein